MSAYHTYGSTSLGLHTSGPQHKNMAQHLQHVTVEDISLPNIWLKTFNVPIPHRHTSKFNA